VTLKPLTDKRGNLVDTPTHDDTRRLTKLIGRLELLNIDLPKARAALEENISDAVHAQGQGGGSGISDTVARAAVAIAGYQEQQRALTRALKSVEEKVEHLRVESERSLCKLTAAEPEVTTHLHCPKMVLLKQTVYTEHGQALTEETLIRCDKLTAHKVDEANNPIDYDRDGLCDEHRAEANEAMRRAQIEQGRRLRRKGAA
jgi:hypothetical protein